MTAKRFIVIGGMSFTGSTLTCGLFNNVPNVLGVGEAHCILDGPFRDCTIHGPSCALVAKVRSMNPCDANLYNKILVAHGKATTLVTSDKSPAIINRFTRPRQSDAVILFKRPEAFASSNHRHRKVWGPTLRPNAYIDWYRNMLEWAEVQCDRVVVVCYERFASNPLAQFNMLCKKLDLPQIPKLHWPPKAEFHNISGNVRSYMDSRYKGKQTIVLDERWRHDLPKKELKALQSDVELMYWWRKLKNLAI